jgi:hypothetical protein
MARSSSPAPSYGPSLPPHLLGGNIAGSPAKGFPDPIGKSRSMQNMGNYTGQRAAGITKGLAGPDQQMAHAFEAYGKPKESGLKNL